MRLGNRVQGPRRPPGFTVEVPAAPISVQHWRQFGAIRIAGNCDACPKARDMRASVNRSWQWSRAANWIEWSQRCWQTATVACTPIRSAERVGYNIPPACPALGRHARRRFPVRQRSADRSQVRRAGSRGCHAGRSTTLGATVLFTRDRHGGVADRFQRLANVEMPDVPDPVGAVVEHGLVRDDQQVSDRERQDNSSAAAKWQ